MKRRRTSPPDVGRDATDPDSERQPFFAHTLPGRPQPEWETLDAHAAAVGGLARSFAAFGAGDWGTVLGHWHDLGKRSAAFQDYIRRGDLDAGEEEEEEGAPGRVDHSKFGARHALAAMTAAGSPIAGQLLTFCIAAARRCLSSEGVSGLWKARTSYSPIRCQHGHSQIGKR